jgi:hypothetical protein
MAKNRAGKEENHSDAWQRFERAVDVVAKSPSQHRKTAKSLGKHRLSVQLSQVEGGANGEEAKNESRDKENGEKG